MSLRHKSESVKLAFRYMLGDQFVLLMGLLPEYYSRKCGTECSITEL